MTLTSKQKQQLKAKAHKLNPIIFIGNNGFSESVKIETNRALEDHELIKIRVPLSVRDEIFPGICEAVNAELIQQIGGIGVLYRKKTEAK